MLKFNSLYDISVTLGSDSIVYPGDPVFLREVVSSGATGETAEVSKLEFSAHTGTHLDFPAHFFRGAGTTEQYAVQEFIIPAQVVSIADPVAVKRSELENKPIKEHRALLFKTANSVTGLVNGGEFSPRYVYLTEDAAEFCIEKKARLVGLDYLSIERYGEKDYPVHRKFLAHDILILECINLKPVPEGDYILFCFPLKIGGGEASPVRAVLAKLND